MLVIAMVENFLTPWEQFQQSQYSIHDRARENAERKHKMSGENTNSNLTDSSMIDPAPPPMAMAASVSETTKVRIICTA